MTWELQLRIIELSFMETNWLETNNQIVPTGTWLDIRDVMTWANAKQI